MSAAASHLEPIEGLILRRHFCFDLAVHRNDDSSPKTCFDQRNQHPAFRKGQRDIRDSFAGLNREREDASSITGRNLANVRCQSSIC